MVAATRVRQGATLAEAFVKGALLDARHAARTRVERARGTGAWRGVATTVDPLSPAVLADPERWFRSLHAVAPVHYSPARDVWVLNGYGEVRAAGRAHDVLSSADGTAHFRARLPMMVAIDRPAHARLRRIVARDFTKDRALGFGGLARELAVRCVEDVLAAERADVYPLLAAPIPLELIARILGVPDTDRAALRRWSDSAAGAFMADLKPSGLKRLGRFLTDVSEMFDYFEAEIERRRGQPADDAISRLVAYEDDQGALTTEELMWFTLLLLVAGNETTTGVMMALLLSLGRDREQYELLREDPSLIPRAVEEGLRWASPVPAFFRTARAPYEAAGATIPAGARVMLNFAAANRDPSRFPDPDAFDLRREPSEHIAFGSGIHFCLGSHLARVELTVLLETLVERVERLEVVGEPVWRRNASLRGLESLPMRFS